MVLPPSGTSGNAPLGVAKKTRRPERQVPGDLRKKRTWRRLFFWQQRGEVPAKLPLSLKRYWRRPTRAWGRVTRGCLKGGRGQWESVIEWRLRTIHPNPGPHKRDKTEEGKRRRRERRMERRREKRAAKQEKDHLTIVAWNVQRMSLGTFNKRKAKAVAEQAKKEKWDGVLLSELRSEGNGVEWLGGDDDLVAIIHSQRAGVLLRGDLLKKWCEEGQKKVQDERSVSVKMENTVLTATYQPVYTGNNEDEIEVAKATLLKHTKWAKKEEILLVGGDFNAHVGGGEERPGICGQFGIRESNYQGQELLSWCEENELAHVNSFYNHKKRGTWFNNSTKKWYEIDGFLIKKSQRHNNVIKVCTVGDLYLSDHKPKKITLKRKWKKHDRNENKKRVPRIKWCKLRDEDVVNQYRRRVNSLIENSEDTDEANDQTCWNKITNIVVQAAEEVCGKEEKKIENPWMVDKDEDVQRMRGRLNRALERRNTLKVRQRDNINIDLTNEIAESVEEVKNARKEIKRETRRWETEWWNKIIEDCERAGERNDTAEVYRNLKQLGKRDAKKATVNTNLTKEEFKEHFKKVSENRFENLPEDIDAIIEEVEDIRGTPKAEEWKEQLEETPSREEIIEQMNKMKDSAPGEDGVRISYLLKGGPTILDEIVKMVQFMFNNSADKWEGSLKIGLVIPLHKKGDKNNPNNFRGVVLLAMGSRILARILASRLRIWSEKLGLLDDNQSGFRKGRSTADATQIMIRIQEDTEDLRKRLEAKGEEISRDDKPVARLLDLRKAYPRVNKPALWKILIRKGMGEKCLRAIQDLHETTSYKVKSREGDSESWIPERGLREGCPSSPVLFNIFHQPVMRIARKKRKRKAEEMDQEMGIPFNWVPGSSFPSASLWEKKNSECKRVRVDNSLFADDTTITGRAKELEEGLRITKEVMEAFEEKNNDDKEEELVFGTEEGEKIRMLGSYIGRKEDVKQRIKRAGTAWFKIKKQLKGSRMSKRMQARVVQACVESTLLFDVQVRTWRLGDVKIMQRTMDKMYRYIWSRKNKPPLIQMQQEHKNMQNVRNELGVKSVRLKLEKRVLERIGHVMRMEDDRTVKAVTLGWLEDLENHEKRPGKKAKTVNYWKRIVKEAGMDWTDIARLTEDRKIWKASVRERIEHLEKWERRNANDNTEPQLERNQRVVEESFICDIDGCDKVCRSKAGLVNHRRRIHQISREKVTFKCDACNSIFNTKGNLVNHMGGCGGAVASREGLKRCNICQREVTRSNFARHSRACRGEAQQGQGGPRGRKCARKVCENCGNSISAPNYSRHLTTCLGGMAVP